MFIKIKKTKHKSRQAFTLVELVVVLVILAVVAAMLVPALTGYIKKAKLAKVYGEAQDYRVAIQAVATEYYGKKGKELSGTSDGTMGGNIHWEEGIGKQAKDNIKNTPEDKEWGSKVLSLLGNSRGETEPYILVFGVVKEDDEKSLNPYEVVYVGFLKDLKSPSVFYVDGQWTTDYPKNAGLVTKQGSTNYLVRDGKEIPLQFFVVCNRTGTPNDIWVEKAGKDKTLEGHTWIPSTPRKPLATAEPVSPEVATRTLIRPD